MSSASIDESIAVETNRENESQQAEASPNEKSDGPGWYPGKYIGLKKRNNGSPETGVNRDEDRDADADYEDDSKESMICCTVRKIRAKFLERQLIGRIYIYRLAGVVSTALVSEVTADDVLQHLIQKKEKGFDPLENDLMMKAELTGNYKRALSITDTILNSLERRSLSWESAAFAHNTLLTRGSTIGASDPILGMIGWSFTIELSATAHSLLSSRKRYEATRDLAMSEPRLTEQESDIGSAETRRSSFSMSDWFRKNSTAAPGEFTSAHDSVPPAEGHQESTSDKTKEDNFSASKQSFTDTRGSSFSMRDWFRKSSSTASVDEHGSLNQNDGKQDPTSTIDKAKDDSVPRIPEAPVATEMPILFQNEIGAGNKKNK